MDRISDQLPHQLRNRELALDRQPFKSRGRLTGPIIARPPTR